MWVAFAFAKATHIFFFSKNISIYAIFNDQSFNDQLTNDIVSFEQLGPGVLLLAHRILLVDPERTPFKLHPVQRSLQSTYKIDPF